jgi:hypothetical protein
MTHYSDARLKEIFEDTQQSLRESVPTDWCEVIGVLQLLELGNPQLRDHQFVADNLTDRFLSELGESARHDRDWYWEQVGKLVLVFDRPLLASFVVDRILRDLDDPTEGLEMAIRMAEVGMNSNFKVRKLERPYDAGSNGAAG